MKFACHNCGDVVETGTDAWPVGGIHCASCGATIDPSLAGTHKLDPVRPGTSARPNSIEPHVLLEPGVLLGAYQIRDFIGKGGMGAVYRALHTHLDREVALKVLPPDLARDPEFVKRFKREATALAKLQHPNIVAVFDMGVQGEIYFFAMELVEGGQTLRHLLHHKRLSPADALKLVPQLCDALEYAHAHGIIHRDIKPENILLTPSGMPKIADFGLVKLVRGAAGAELTQTSAVMGTLDYMAPEQRHSSKDADHRADIYSMGVVFYEMLTGEVPVGRFDPPSRKVQVDVRLDEVVLKALDSDPDRRYQRATHMGGAVTRIAETPAAAATATTSRSTIRLLVFLGLAAALVVAGIVALGGIAVYSRASNEREMRRLREMEEVKRAAVAAESKRPADMPPSPLDPEMQALERGKDAMKKSDYDKAVEAFNTALEIRPFFPDAYPQRARAYLGLEQYDKALADVDEALHLKPGWDEARYLKVDILIAAGRKTDALAMIDTMQKEPGLTEMWKAFLDYRRCMLEEKFGEAREAMDRALAINRTPQALYNRADALHHENRNSEALQDVDKALEMKPGWHEAQSLRLEILIDLGEKKEAIRTIEERLKNPSVPKLVEARLREQLKRLEESP